MANRRLKRRALLAAPIVATALFAPACAPTRHMNPGPSKEPPTEPEMPEPDTSPDEAPEPETPETPEPAGPLPDAPKDGGGKLVTQADGTCLYRYPPPDMSCPPNRTCNPGPPRAPLRVKCPDGGGKQ
jgi:hypothetical protein